MAVGLVHGFAGIRQRLHPPCTPGASKAAVPFEHRAAQMREVIMAVQRQLQGKRIAIVATDGVEQVELTEPKKALDEAGAQTVVISPKARAIKAWQNDHWGDEIPVDRPLDSARPDDFDALLLPGGVINADALRMEERAVQFVRRFFEAGKPVAVICHAPWMLVEADVARGRTLTSWPSLQTDLRNAGADWVDREVVTDEGLVTSRKPDDIPAFNRKMLEEFAEGVHDAQRIAARQARHQERAAGAQREAR
jgi:protease I